MRQTRLEALPIARAFALASAALALSGCGTMRGVGSDVTSVYQAAASTVGLSGSATNRGGFNVYDPQTGVHQ